MKAIYWKFFNKEKYHYYKILKWIKATKKYYKQGKCRGLCAAFTHTIPNNWFMKNIKKYQPFIVSVLKYIPEYNPEFFGTQIIEVGFDSGFWWPSSDTISREKALDKLIEIYKQKIQNC